MCGEADGEGGEMKNSARGCLGEKEEPRANCFFGKGPSFPCWMGKLVVQT